jgi:hypothetical protein
VVKEGRGRDVMCSFLKISEIMATAASVPPQNNKILPMADKNEKGGCIFNDFLCRLSIIVCTEH